MEIISIPVGFDGDWQGTAKQFDGTPVAFTGNESITFRVWAGGDQPTLFTKAGSFVSAAAGTIKLTLAAADTASLSPGFYRIQGFVVSLGRTLRFFDGGLKLTPSPGSGAALSSYCGRQDLLDLAPWIEDLEDLDADKLNFAEDRAKARKWFERWILMRHWRWIERKRLWEGYRPDAPTPTQMQTFLTAGALNLADGRSADRITEINARYSIYLIASNQIGPSDRKNPYEAMARDYLHLANRLLPGLVLQFDTNTDGIQELEQDDRRLRWLVDISYTPGLTSLFVT